MCGLVAWLCRSDEAHPMRVLGAALEQLRPRGPDGEGTWIDEGVALGHRRLAVIDLDKRAAQPMQSADGRYVIVYNGEIYNYRELREEMRGKGVSFRTTSDTEVLLALFADRGEAMLPRLHGMFALIIWDRVTRRAFAARDPYGIKPLYIAQNSKGTFVASQVKALLATGLVSREPDVRGQAGFWLLGSVPEPRTWFREICALPAGHYFWIEQGRFSTPKCWWDIGDAWRAPLPVRIGEAEVRDRVRGALKRSIARHLEADVPIGVFLSGGVDSGALAGLMVEAGATALEGVTLTYDEFRGTRADEAPVAGRIAAHYGIRHHVRRVTRYEFLADMPRILAAMDQPSIDGINTWYASKAVAERGLKVVVSGVGGDELFQGFESFRELPQLVMARKAVGAIPGGVAALQVWADRCSKRTGNHRWQHLPKWSESIAGAWWLRRSLYCPGDLPQLMGHDAAKEALKEFDATKYVQSMSGPLPTDMRLALGQIESSTYLRNQLLRDSDWASMDHSVELRTPLVDAWLLNQVQDCLPAFERFASKELLARAAEKSLPDDIIRRRKTGFGIPSTSWAVSGHDSGIKLGIREWARMLVDGYSASIA